jgi:hypothetical protein
LATADINVTDAVIAESALNSAITTCKGAKNTVETEAPGNAIIAATGDKKDIVPVADDTSLDHGAVWVLNAPTDYLAILNTAIIAARNTADNAYINQNQVHCMVMTGMGMPMPLTGMYNLMTRYL